MSEEYSIDSGRVVLTMKNGKETRVDADLVIEEMHPQLKVVTQYTLKKGGTVVGRYPAEHFVGWRRGHKAAMSSSVRRS